MAKKKISSILPRSVGRPVVETRTSTFFNEGDLRQILFALSLNANLPIQNQVARAISNAMTLRIFQSSRLPPERKLAELLGVSRPTIRQALLLLRKAGLTSAGSSTRAGTSLKELSRSSHTNLLKNLYQEIQDIMEFRIALETWAVRLATRAADSNFINKLNQAINENEKSSNPSEFRRSDTVFHLAIAQQTKNFHLISAIAIARSEFLRYRDMHPMPDNVALNVSEHRKILISIMAGDQDGAAAAMTAHLQSSLHTFIWSVANLENHKKIKKHQQLKNKKI